MIGTGYPRLFFHFSKFFYARLPVRYLTRHHGRPVNSPFFNAESVSRFLRRWWYKYAYRGNLVRKIFGLKFLITAHYRRSVVGNRI